MTIGYVYILFNPAFRENRFKVGRTTRTPEERASELSAFTGVPAPYEVHYKERVRDCVLAEQLIHKKLHSLRLDSRKEFFEAPLNEIIAVLRAIAEEVGIVGEDAAPGVEPTAEAPVASELHEFSPDHWEVDIKWPDKSEQILPKLSGKRPTVEEHLRKVETEVREVFALLRKQLMDLAGVREKSLTYGIAYEAAGRNFIEMIIKRHRLDLGLRPLDYDDPDGIIEDFPYRTLSRWVQLSRSEEFERVWTLVEQSYRDVAQG